MLSFSDLYEDVSDELELNGTALKNNQDVGLYAKTFLGEGKSIQKINQEEDDKKNDDDYNQSKAIEEISRNNYLHIENKAPIVQMAPIK